MSFFFLLLICMYISQVQAHLDLAPPREPQTSFIMQKRQSTSFTFEIHIQFLSIKSIID